jgi:hypothetical protein
MAANKYIDSTQASKVQVVIGRSGVISESWVESVLFLILWTSVFFNGAIWMTQLAVFGAHIISTHTPLIILVFLLTLFYAYRVVIVVDTVFISWVMFFVLCFFSGFIDYSIAPHQYLDLKASMLLIVVPLLYYLLIALIAGMRINISQKLTNIFLIISGIIAISIGIYQQLNGYSGFMLEYVKEVGSSNYLFFGMIRPISIFTEISTYGFFLAFASGMALWAYIKERRLFYRIILSCLFTILGLLEYFTFTRTTYLIFIVIVVFIIAFSILRRILVYAPLFAFLAGVAIYFGAPLISGLTEGLINHVASDQSVYIRYDEAIQFIHIIFKNPYYMLFGPGINASYLINKKVYIDNTYLTVLVQSGLVGLFLYTGAFCALWLKLFRLARAEPTPLRVAIAAFFGAWPCAGFFAVDNSYILIASLGLVLSPISSLGMNYI